MRYGPFLFLLGGWPGAVRYGCRDVSTGRGGLGLFAGGIDTTATYHIVDALLTGFVPTPPVEIPAHADDRLRADAPS